MNIWDYLRYNKVSTGISGLDKIFFDGLVIPYERSKNLLIAIRGDNDKEKTAFTLQLIHSIGSTLKKKCGIKQTVNISSEKAYVVVQRTIKHFFMGWLVIWLLWIIFYGVDIAIQLEMQNATNPSGNPTVYALNEFQYLLDFLTSAALFSVYYILNNVTVDISDRTSFRNPNLFIIVTLCVLMFGILLTFQIFYLTKYNPNTEDYSQFDIYTKIILGLFSSISFVLVLGKLNSNFLEIPRLLMIFLYIYAVIQLSPCMEYLANKANREVYNMLKMLTPWFFSFGKAALLMALSWILYKKRLVFYILHRRLSITETNAKLNKFNRYLSD